VAVEVRRMCARSERARAFVDGHRMYEVVMHTHRLLVDVADEDGIAGRPVLPGAQDLGTGSRWDWDHQLLRATSRCGWGRVRIALRSYRRSKPRSIGERHHDRRATGCCA
jgi:hypothetical protein